MLLKQVAAICLAVTCLLSTFIGAEAQTVGGNCAVNTVAFKESDSTFSTQSQDLVVITGMSIRFTQSAPGCIVVQYTSYADTTQTGASYIGFKLDGVEKVQLYASKLPDPDYQLRTVTYVIKNVAVGDHVLRMRLKSNDGQQVGSHGPKVLTLHYRR